MEPNNKAQKIVDDPSIAPIFCNKVVSTLVDQNGTIVLTLGDIRWVPDRLDPHGRGESALYVTCRIALSLAAASEVANALSKPLEQIKTIITTQSTSPASRVKN